MMPNKARDAEKVETKRF